MKRLLLAAVVTLAPFLASHAQVSLGGEPISFKADFIRLADIQSIRIESPDRAAIDAEDALAESNGKPPRYAVHIPLNLNLNNSGTWMDLKGGARVWRLRVETSDALATTLLYDEFELPEGSKMHIYNDDRTSVLGAFSAHNNEDGGTFATQLLLGKACTIEYYEPANVRGEGVLEISDLGYCYRYAIPPVFGDFSRGGGSDPCQVDVNCSEGNSWQDEKQGAVGIGLVFPNGSSWCSGSMVNNTSLDCSQLMLTALHCTESSSNNNFGQYTIYYNYEISGCGSGSITTNQSVVGCSPLGDSGDGGGNSGSDFSLVEISPTIPSSYNVYYNGWNANNSPSGSGVSIHHPNGDRKKISTYTTPLTTGGWGINNTHWNVRWAGTNNGHGVTEGGSSGSPLFDNQGRIVGTLTGGGSFCVDVPNPSQDQYGKMSYHWTSNPGDDLKDFLDPVNTGQLTLEGTYAPCTPANQYDAGISDVSSPVGSNCTDFITPVVTLSNYGSQTLTSVNINYNVDGVGTQIYVWTGSIGINQSVEVTLPNVSVTGGNHVFNANTSQPNGQSDENNSNNASASAFTSTIADTYVSLVLNLDDYGSETTWELVQSGGGQVASGGPYNDFENLQINQELCVASGQCYTFTIYDELNDGICCYTGTQNQNYSDGNYSIGNASGVSLFTGSEFAGEESFSFCVPSSATGCDTLYDPFFGNANGFFIYPNQNGGYIAGSNSFNDQAKAQAFTAPQQPVEITGVVFWTAAKVDAGANVTVNVYELDGNGTNISGAVNTAPGTVLTSAIKSLSRIDTSGFFYNFVEFASPVIVSSGFAVGLDFSGFGNDDEIGIVTNTDGDAAGADLAWEQWSNGEWHSMNEAWNTASDGDFDLGIFPVVCPQNITGIASLEGQFGLFPNPNNGEFVIVNTNGFEGDLQVFDALGQVVLQQTLIGETTSNLSILNQENGIYVVRITTDSGVWSNRIVVSK